MIICEGFDREVPQPLGRIRVGGMRRPSELRIRDFGFVAVAEGTPAAHVFQRKQDLGRIRSAAGRIKWENIVDKHLVPAFGDLFIDQLRPSDIKA